MTNPEKVAAFLLKWRGHVSEDPSFMRDCEALGFEMDAARSLSAAFPEVPVLTPEGFRSIAGRITRIRFLGTAIFSFWRYRTHWCDGPGGGVDSDDAKEWLEIAFNRLQELLEQPGTSGRAPSSSRRAGGRGRTTRRQRPDSSRRTR